MDGSGSSTRMADWRLKAEALHSSSSDLRLRRMHHMTKKPSIAKPARHPAIPPTTAAVLTDPEELAVEEGVADVSVPVLMMILVGDVAREVVCKVAAAGVVVGTVCGTTVVDVDEAEVVEEEEVVEDEEDEEVVEEEEVVEVVEEEDCWVEVATLGAEDVGVEDATGAEELVGVSVFCAPEFCTLVAAEKADSGRVGLKRAATRGWLRLSK